MEYIKTKFYDDNGGLQDDDVNRCVLILNKK